MPPSINPKLLLDFAAAHPGQSLLLFGVLVLAWKAKRHRDPGSRYSLWEAWRYPDDLALTGAALIACAVGAWLLLR